MLSPGFPGRPHESGKLGEPLCALHRPFAHTGQMALLSIENHDLAAPNELVGPLPRPHPSRDFFGLCINVAMKENQNCRE